MEKMFLLRSHLLLILMKLNLIEKTYINANLTNNARLMVGFNRRFAPHIVKMKELY